MQTSVLSLQRWVEVATTSPKTQLSCSEGWKFDPSTVTSIPPIIGPEDGMSRWMRGGGVGVMGEGSGKNMKGSVDEARESCRSWYWGTDIATGDGGAVGRKVEGETPRAAFAKDVILTGR
jgi:hypothetical protein